MKKIFILLVLLVNIFSNHLFPQGLDTKEEITINKNVYIFESKRLYLKDNKFKDLSTRTVCEYFYDEEYSDNSFIDVIMKAFEKERIKELAYAKQAFLINLICNKEGNVLEMVFVIPRLNISKKGDKYSLSFEEIDKLEKHLRTYSVKLKNICPDVLQYTIHRLCRFTDILESINLNNRDIMLINQRNSGFTLSRLSSGSFLSAVFLPPLYLFG